MLRVPPFLVSLKGNRKEQHHFGAPLKWRTPNIVVFPLLSLQNRPKRVPLGWWVSCLGSVCVPVCVCVLAFSWKAKGKPPMSFCRGLFNSGGFPLGVPLKPTKPGSEPQAGSEPTFLGLRLRPARAAAPGRLRRTAATRSPERLATRQRESPAGGRPTGATRAKKKNKKRAVGVLPNDHR